MNHDPANVYRDATFSKAMRDQLEDSASMLEAYGRSAHAEVVRNVVARWDANEATEMHHPLWPVAT